MDRIYYYAWLNGKPVKKFSKSEKSSIQIVFRQFLKYGMGKLKINNVEMIKDKSCLGGAYLYNGIDKVELKEETGIEDMLRINKEKIKKELKRTEKIGFENTDFGKRVMNDVALMSN